MKHQLRAAIPTLSRLSLGCISLTVGICGCAQTPPPFDPRAMQNWERAQDAQVKSRPMYPLPTTMQSPFVPGSEEVQPPQPGTGVDVPEGPPVVMPLQEIIHRAVVNSLDIRVASYDTAVDQTRLMEAEAKFDPAFFTNFNFQRTNNQSGGIITSFDPTFNTATRIAFFNQQDQSTFQTGFQADLAAGGQVKIQYQVQNTWTNPKQTALNPYYQNDLSLTLTQPLLQNFGTGVNQARITISRNNQRVSLLDWRKTVEDTILQIEKTYWQLVQAKRDLETLERLTAASEQTTNVLFHRQAADVSAVQIQQSNAATESRRAAVNDARSRIADLSDQLKRLMDDPQFPVSGAVIITPAEDEVDVPLHFDLPDQIETALENRLELGQQQIRIESAEIAMEVARNNLLPQLNFQGSVTSDGLAAKLNDAFRNQGEFNHIGYALGLQFQYPLGNRAARAIWQRALLQRQQSIESYRQLIEQSTLDVKTAARAVTTTWSRWRILRNGRFGAADALMRLQQQQDAGAQPFTPEAVQLRLQLQEQLAQTEEAEHQAANDYNFAIANLEKMKGTILRYNNVILEEEALPFDMQLKTSERQFHRTLHQGLQPAR